MDTQIKLEDLSVAAPCSAKWAQMTGDERARFCGLCKKHVYNISAMSRDEAEALIRQNEGDVCIRLYKRADGTVILDNCPVGLRAIRRRVRWMVEGVVAAVALCGTVIMVNASRASSGRSTTLKEWFFPAKPRVPQAQSCVMGKMAAPLPVSPPPPGSGATAGDAADAN
jgi:hypothetical protein